MNTREHVDLTKMAITAMLLVLVLSAGLSLFYLLYKVLNDEASRTSQAVSTTSIEKLLDLTNETKSGERPWVSSVINAISEVDTEDILYIQVTGYGIPAPKYFTYENVTLSGVPGSQVVVSGVPLDECCKYLLGYTNRRCQILLDNYDYGGLTYYYVAIYVEQKEI